MSNFNFYSADFFPFSRCSVLQWKREGCWLSFYYSLRMGLIAWIEGGNVKSLSIVYKSCIPSYFMTGCLLINATFFFNKKIYILDRNNYWFVFHTISPWFCKKGDYWVVRILNSHVHNFSTVINQFSSSESVMMYSNVEFELALVAIQKGIVLLHDYLGCCCIDYSVLMYRDDIQI